MDESSVNWDNSLEHAEASDIGLRRANNQDAYAFRLAGSQESWRLRGHLFMVADGMGAHAAGELASKMATDAVVHSYYKLPDESPVTAVQKAIVDANHRIHSRGQANLDFRGMGTTTSVLLLVPQGAVVAHVGDSRVYRLRGNRLEQLTFDHSLVWEMMSSGQLRRDEVPSYIPKNIITRSLGPAEDVQVDLEGPFPLVPGDTFLLCSDGLTGQVDDEELGVILGALPVAEAVQVLVDLANLRGGPDNITILVAKVKGEDLAHVSGPDVLERSSRPAQSVPVWAWILIGVLAVVALGLAIMQSTLAAVVTGATALIGLAGAILRRYGSGGTAQNYPEPGKLGRGPHSSCVCRTNNQFVDKLAKIVQQLRDAANEEHWKVNWLKFNAFCTRAQTAAENRSYVEGVREYCRAISFMMEELRTQRKRLPATNSDEAHDE